MPAALDKCQHSGGKIRTIKPSKDKYMHVCIDKKGKSHKGYVKNNKKGK